jgi:hypothetical protein
LTEPARHELVPVACVGVETAPALRRRVVSAVSRGYLFAAELARIIFIIPIIMKLLLCAFAASAAHAAVHKMSVRKTPITLAGVAEGALHTRGVLGALAREHAGYGGNGVVPISTLEDAQYYGPIGWGTPPQVRAEAGRLCALPAAR